jgi:hypothetical protein
LPVSVYQPVFVSQDDVSNSGAFVNASKGYEIGVIKESQKEAESKNWI